MNKQKTKRNKNTKMSDITQKCVRVIMPLSKDYYRKNTYKK
jgi:hypothetical protein